MIFIYFVFEDQFLAFQLDVHVSLVEMVRLLLMKNRTKIRTKELFLIIK
jgi:hypothetical protein